MNRADQITPRRRLPLYILFGANAISMVGNVLTAIAIPWFVLQTTGSATQTGITAFFNVLPVAVAGLLGGNLIDRLGYKRTSVIADIASGATVALVPLLYFTVGLEFWQLMLLVFCGALLDAPGSTGRDALVPELAAMAGMPIERATSATQAIERGSRLISAPLAGLLIAALGPANVLWLDAATFFISAAMVGLLVAAPRIERTPKGSVSYWAEIVEGLGFIRRDALILAILATVMITNFLDAPYGAVILPVYANQFLGSAVDLGLIIAMNGGGALTGAIIFGAIGDRLPRRATFIWMFVFVGMRFWLLALMPPLGVLLLGTLIFSIGAGPLNPIIGAVEYERIPADMRGRVFGVVTAVAWLAMPIGMLLGGVLIEKFGVQLLLIILGICYLATTLTMLVNPAIREMDRRVVPEKLVADKPT